MRAVGIKTLKNRLSEYVKLASGGEVILVTDRDRVVAELVPTKADRSTDAGDALLADAVRHGWLRPPALPDEGPPPRMPVGKFRTILSELAKDRADR